MIGLAVRACRSLDQKRYLRWKVSRMQLEDTFVQFPICGRKTMVQAKIVGPGRPAKCLCPLQRFLKVVQERPMPGTDAALPAPTFAHEV